MAQAALLLEHFGIGPDEWGYLTPKYIFNVCFHRRDKKTGRIKLLEEYKVKLDVPQTQQQVMSDLDYLASILGQSLINYAEAKTEVLKKYNEKGRIDDGSGSGTGAN